MSDKLQTVEDARAAIAVKLNTSVSEMAKLQRELEEVQARFHQEQTARSEEAARLTDQSHKEQLQLTVTFKVLHSSCCDTEAHFIQATIAEKEKAYQLLEEKLQDAKDKIAADKEIARMAEDDLKVHSL